MALREVEELSCCFPEPGLSRLSENISLRKEKIVGEKQTEDLIKKLKDAEAVELDDNDLDAVAGGAGDCNCTCGGSEFEAQLAAGDCNCGC